MSLDPGVQDSLGGVPTFDEVDGSICQGKSTKCVKDACYVGDRGEQPVEVVLVDTLWKERDNSEEFTRDGTECAE